MLGPNCCPGRIARLFPCRGERRASRRRQYLKATMPRIISNKDRTNAPIIKRLPVIGDPSPRMCGLNLTGMCWSPRLGQENSWMQPDDPPIRSEEHTSELQSLMRISYAVFCLKKKQFQITIK